MACCCWLNAVLNDVGFAVGPDLRKNHTEAQTLQDLTTAYKNIFCEFAHSHKRILRLLPVSAGIFSGSYRERMPALTFECIHAAFASLSDHVRAELTSERRELHLCIFMESEMAMYTDAAQEKGSLVAAVGAGAKAAEAGAGASTLLSRKSSVRVTPEDHAAHAKHGDFFLNFEEPSASFFVDLAAHYRGRLKQAPPPDSLHLLMPAPDFPGAAAPGSGHPAASATFPAASSYSVAASSAASASAASQQPPRSSLQAQAHRRGEVSAASSDDSSPPLGGPLPPPLGGRGSGGDGSGAMRRKVRAPPGKNRRGVSVDRTPEPTVHGHTTSVSGCYGAKGTASASRARSASVDRAGSVALHGTEHPGGQRAYAPLSPGSWKG